MASCTNISQYGTPSISSRPNYAHGQKGTTLIEKEENAAAASTTKLEAPVAPPPSFTPTPPHSPYSIPLLSYHPVLGYCALHSPATQYVFIIIDLTEKSEMELFRGDNGGSVLPFFRFERRAI